VSNIDVNGTHIAVDKEGYLRSLSDWSPEVAQAIANNEGITLSEAHWEILWLLRDFYQTFELSPAMRPLVKYIGQHLGTDKGRSIYLMQLFPGSPAKLSSKLAGLPKPDNCL
jgi:tRNA 2-thiouridine synthesizing protein E